MYFSQKAILPNAYFIGYYCPQADKRTKRIKFEFELYESTNGKVYPITNLRANQDKIQLKTASQIDFKPYDEMYFNGSWWVLEPSGKDYQAVAPQAFAFSALNKNTITTIEATRV